MTEPRAPVQVSRHVLERLTEISREVHAQHDRGHVSISNLVSLLIDHWHSTPPRREWLRNQANLYPADRTPRNSSRG